MMGVHLDGILVDIWECRNKEMIMGGENGRFELWVDGVRRDLMSALDF